MITILSLRAQRSNPVFFWIAASLTLIAMTLSINALAEDKEQKAKQPSGFTYSPDFCDFTVQFPEEPYLSQRCEKPEECVEQASYTQVFDLSATVNFRVVCNRSSENLYKDYSTKVMQTTLQGMAKSHYTKLIDSTIHEEDAYKQAGLVASGQAGRSDKIYIAQLWIGHHSVMSVEAELIGEPIDVADALFGQMLSTVKYSGVKKPQAEDKETEERESENETSDTKEKIKKED